MEQWEHLLTELRSEFILREQELEFLHEIDSRLLAEQSPSFLFGFIVDRTQKLLGASHAAILLRRSTYLEPTYSTLKSAIGQRMPIRESLAGLSLERNEVVNVPDLLTGSLNTRYTPLRGYKGTAMRSLLAAPILIRGTTVGVLNVESTSPRAFKPEHGRIATAIAAQIAVALQRTQGLAAEIVFSDIDRLMFATPDSQRAAQQSEKVIQAALEKVMVELTRLEHIQHTGAQIMFLRAENELEVVHSTNPVDIGLIVRADRSVCGRAVRERKTIIVGDVNTDPEYQRMLGGAIRSEIVVPILYGDDDVVIGVLNVESDEVNAFYGFYQVLLEGFAERVRTLLAFAKLRADLTESMELRNANDLLLAVGDQTSHIIHRLNNTVGAMRAHIMELQELQATRRLDEGFLGQSLEALHGLADRTLRMPEDMRLLLSEEAATVDVNDCVTSAVSQIELPTNIELDLVLFEGMPRQSLYCFDIVVANIIQNAIDAMPNGGRLSVSTSAIIDPTGSSGYLQLTIRDTGVGIPDDIQERIFDRNFTTKRASGRGMGFGLWWVRTFVRRVRGDIAVASTPGAGTEVSVKIPLTQTREPAEAVNIH